MASNTISTKDHTSFDEILKRSIDLLIAVGVMVINIIEIILLSRIQRRKKIHEIVLLSISVADLLFGFANSATCVMYLLNKSSDYRIMYTIFTIYIVFVLASISHLVLIAFDLGVAVMKPLHYKRLVTRKKIYRILAVIWMVTITTSGTIYATSYDAGFPMKSTSPNGAHEKTNIRSCNTTSSNTAFNESLNTHFSEKLHTTSITTPSKSFTTFSTKAPTATKPKRKLINRQVTDTQIDNDCRITLRNQTFEKLPRSKPPGKKPEGEYKDIVFNVISYMIISASILIVMLYGTIMYKFIANKKKSNRSNSNVSVICFLVASSFVLFSSPYAVNCLLTGKIPQWANALLVANSAINSIVYFFRGRIGRKNSRNSNQTKQPSNKEK